MTALVSRRGFLRQATQTQDRSLRPPGADGDRFLDLCSRCAACATACSDKVILIDRAGRPVLDFASGPCTFCGACAEACPTDALRPDLVTDWPWRPVVASRCLSMNAVTCRTCEDSCDALAIRFDLQLGGRATPVIAPELCTGCGACIGSCPVSALTLEKAPTCAQPTEVAI